MRHVCFLQDTILHHVSALPATAALTALTAVPRAAAPTGASGCLSDTSQAGAPAIADNATASQQLVTLLTAADWYATPAAQGVAHARAGEAVGQLCYQTPNGKSCGGTEGISLQDWQGWINTDTSWAGKHTLKTRACHRVHARCCSLRQEVITSPSQPHINLRSPSLLCRHAQTHALPYVPWVHEQQTGQSCDTFGMHVLMHAGLGIRLGGYHMAVQNCTWLTQTIVSPACFGVKPAADCLVLARERQLSLADHGSDSTRHNKVRVRVCAEPRSLRWTCYARHGASSTLTERVNVLPIMSAGVGSRAWPGLGSWPGRPGATATALVYTQAPGHSPPHAVRWRCPTRPWR